MGTQQTSFPREKTNILLLEGIHESAKEVFRRAGYEPRQLPRALSEDELIEELSQVHVLGIRSKTEVTARALSAAPHLLAVGCFCIGTNQVSLSTASSAGIPVFNAPFSNTRSVAELTIAEIIMLARRASYRSEQMHRGEWNKSAKGSYEVRGKKLGIVGYGHIGPQVGLLGEALGMQVLYYDTSKKLPLGNAVPVSSLEALLSDVDFLTLHVPETPQTKNMIGARELHQMKEGSFLINLSRGTVVEIAALAEALRSGQLAGAAIDVYPEEPSSNGASFASELQGLPNVILTPHIGGSTEEAQQSIGVEVADSLLAFLEAGSTVGAVNFPHVALPYLEGNHRVLNIHRNEPGVLVEINTIIAETGANIAAQYLGTQVDIGYLIVDVERELSREVKDRLDGVAGNIRTRLLF
ncbi:phosphoglycerate dehydrogenase [bacterium]|nr:phosphoglycerate dehydrogenase [bacterium]